MTQPPTSPHVSAATQKPAATCKGCGAAIAWITTLKGKAMPCDPGAVNVVTEDGQLVRGYIPHWATCPKAGQFKRR